MGLDLQYQAMPENCRLLIRACQDSDFGENLEFFRFYALKSQEAIAHFNIDPLLSEFVSEVRRTVQQYPGLEHRNFYFGRRWDMLYYLLSERRRKGERRNNSHWVEKAIFGGEVLNVDEKTQTVIGSPIHYLSPVEVSDTRDHLETVTIEMLRTHWNPREMYEAGVYKIHSDEDEDSFKWIKEDFEKLKAFYALISEDGEGILTFIS